METRNTAHRALFTDFTYDNIGLPSNSLIPTVVEKMRVGSDYLDLGLAVTVKDKEMVGKFKVPTLRNISKSAPYMHNGYFANLRDVVEFYNTRDTKAVCTQKNISVENAKKLNCWPAAETPETMNKEELGNLRLTEQEVDDIVVFLKTLDDGYKKN
jgi:cytochrome c peroxidase